MHPQESRDRHEEGEELERVDGQNGEDKEHVRYRPTKRIRMDGDMWSRRSSPDETSRD